MANNASRIYQFIVRFEANEGFFAIFGKLLEAGDLPNQYISVSKIALGSQLPPEVIGTKIECLQLSQDKISCEGVDES